MIAYAGGTTDTSTTDDINSYWDNMTRGTGSTTGDYAYYSATDVWMTGITHFNNFGSWVGLVEVDFITITIKGFCSTFATVAPIIQIYLNNLPVTDLISLSPHTTLINNIYLPIQVTGITLNDLTGNTLTVKYIATKTNITNTAYFYIDYVKVETFINGSNVEVYKNGTYTTYPLYVYRNDVFIPAAMLVYRNNNWVKI